MQVSNEIMFSAVAVSVAVASRLYASWRWPKPVWREVVFAGIGAAVGALGSHKPSALTLVFVISLVGSVALWSFLARGHTISQPELKHSVAEIRMRSAS